MCASIYPPICIKKGQCVSVMQKNVFTLSIARWLENDDDDYKNYYFTFSSHLIVIKIVCPPHHKTVKGFAFCLVGFLAFGGGVVWWQWSFFFGCHLTFLWLRLCDEMMITIIMIIALYYLQHWETPITPSISLLELAWLTNRDLTWHDWLPLLKLI